MIRFLADENFNDKIIRGVLARNVIVDVLRWLEIGRQGEDDPIILEMAARQGRVVLTHDFETMIGFAYERVERGQSMPGIVAVNTSSPIRPVIEDLLLIIEAAVPSDHDGQVVYLPYHAQF